MKNSIIAILAIVIIGLAVFVATGKREVVNDLPFEEGSVIEEGANLETELDEETVDEVSQEEIPMGDSLPNFTSAVVYIHLPQPEMMSCEENSGTVARSVTFEKTSSVLTSALEGLLDLSEAKLGDEQFQNWVSSERGFSLDRVSVEGGIAKVYFNNTKTEPFTSDCHPVWFKKQVTDTAKEYDTINTVEVYINDKLI